MSRRTALWLPAILPLLAAGTLALAGCSGSGGGKEAGTPASQACAGGVTPAAGLVVTDQGPVQGVRSGETYVFKGIPYAQPPVGELRFKPPEPPGCSGGILEASTFGNKCPQLDSSAKVVGDEDCLYLNVWQPAQPPGVNNPRPVMFFIHGGGNVQGSASQQLADGTYIYDGEQLASNGDVVVVTINYRLGPFGWLAHPALTSESGNDSSGNYGLLDEIAALQWVRRNISAFGGDPSQVMVFGESAGALDTCALVASPLAKDLFSRALMESGGCLATPQAQREAAGEAAASKAGCDTAGDLLTCLRGLSTEQLMAAGAGTVNVAGVGIGSYGPVIDGYALKDQPNSVIAAGEHNHVPMVIGSNSDETSTYVPAIPTCQQYAAAVRSLYPTLADEALQQYPCEQYPTPQKAYIALTSDARFICTARRDARAFVKGQQEATFRYVFTHGIDTPQGKANGAFHGLELLWVFQHLNVSGYTPSKGELALADAMLQYWTQFAATGDPNADGVPPWPQYDADSDPYLALDTAIKAGSGYRGVQCNFWDSVVAQLLNAGS